MKEKNKKIKSLEDEITLLKERIDVITSITSTVVGNISIEKLGNEICEKINKSFKTDACIIRLIKDDELILLGSCGIEDKFLNNKIPKNLGIANEIITKKQPITIQNVKKNEITKNILTLHKNAFQFLSYAGAPLIVGSDVIGIIGIYTVKKIRNFSENDLKELVILANHIAIALLNSKLYNELSEKTLKLEEEIEKRKIIEFNLIKAKEEAEEANIIKSCLINNLNHEIRTPVNGIIGYVHIINKMIEDDEILKKLDKINYSCIRLIDTLDAIYEYSSLESKQISFKNSEISLTEKIKSISQRFKEIASSKNLYLNIVLPENEIKITSDEMFLNILFRRLIDNAIKFTNKGGVDIILTTEIINEKNFAVVEIIDTGIGIDEEKKNIIFKEFRQESEGFGRSYEGIGLGLTISRKMVELNGGFLTLESKKNEGTKIKVALPI